MWISVNERLPRAGQLVSVRTENGKVMPAKLREILNPDTGIFEKKWYVSQRNVGGSKITHWRAERWPTCRKCGGK